MFRAFKKIYDETEDKERETIDLRLIVSDVIKKEMDVLNATICENNKKIRIWAVHDFTEKIEKLFGKDKKEEEQKISEDDKIKSENKRKRKKFNFWKLFFI